MDLIQHNTTANTNTNTTTPRTRNDDNDNNDDLLGKLSMLRGTGLWTAGGGVKDSDDTGYSSLLSANSNTIDEIRLCDGPHGVRKQLNDLSLQEAHPATCFPPGCALASSWNVDLLRDVGEALASECGRYDVQVLLGPGMNLKRHPACGRNMEYFSECPTLSGLLAAAYVNGVQSTESSSSSSSSSKTKKVAACLKHFAVNNQESHRMVVDVMVDERTLRELYLQNFEIALQHSDPKMIMGSYNKLNGVYCCENKWLLDYVLRQEWKWGERSTNTTTNTNSTNTNTNTNTTKGGGGVGICVTDWGATNHRAKAIAAGMDLEMPGSSGTRQGVCDAMVRDAVLLDEGGEDASDVIRGLEKCTTRMRHFLRHWEEEDDDDDEEDGDGDNGNHENETSKDATTTTTTTTTNDDTKDLFESNHDLAYEAALECVVLLQNHNDVLPLPLDHYSYAANNHDDDDEIANKKTIAVIGAFAKESRYQGMGSSHVTPTKVENAHDVLTKLLLLNGNNDNNDDDDDDGNSNILPYAAGYDPDPQHTDDDIDDALIEEAQEVAKNANVVLLFLGLPEILESEGFDRDHLRLPKQQISLLQAIWTARGGLDRDRIVVILSNGGALELPNTMIDHCSSILEGYLWGQAGAKAVVDLIFANNKASSSPCGKLPETFPIQQSDIPSDAYFPGTRHVVEYREGLDVGYRYFDSPKCPKKVRFPFGHGLTYTTFAYQNLKVDVLEDEKRSKRVVVECDIFNSGTTYSAREIVQCYVAPRFGGIGIFRPYHQLQAFTKVPLLKPGERKTVQFELGFRAFAVWDIGHEGWTVEAGDYEIQIGASGQDIRLQSMISFHKGEDVTAKAIEAYPAPSTSGDVTDNSHDSNIVTDDVFVKRFGDNSAAAAIQAYRDEPPLQTPHIHRNSMMKEVATVSLLGRLLLEVVVRIANMEIPKNSPAYRRETRMIRANVDNLPLRTLILFSKGALSFEFLDALISVMNGQVIQAITGFLWMFRCWVVDKASWFF
jgi:beta-glucosidase